ncbi:Os04g0607200 [Oryza sativa Japonica Group]|uniref:Os04g0607200 protein n=2 Tax=Oryza sativa subsp. japonica TaxID=39947 RepID=B9FCD7_ORYSJ|nr:hypothetical protein OsJ_16086 [Oryza sativa Japonica Group]KAB8096839.1 hypothetical protein EE612_025425 [Oryza sativa]BAS90903.1 Os04g0607200 [Oryza sativa Japonica Group]
MRPPDLSGRKRWAGEPANHSSSGAPTQEKEQVDGRARWILQFNELASPSSGCVCARTRYVHYVCR